MTFTEELISVSVQSGVFGLIIAITTFYLNRRLEKIKGKQTIRVEIGKRRAEAFIEVFSKLDSYFRASKGSLMNTALRIHSEAQNDESKISLIIKEGKKEVIAISNDVNYILEMNSFLLQDKYRDKAYTYNSRVSQLVVDFYSSTTEEKYAELLDSLPDRIKELEKLNKEVRNDLLNFE